MPTRRAFIASVVAGANLFATPSLLHATSLKDVRIGYDVPDFDLLRAPSRLSSVAAGNMCGMVLEPLVRIGGKNRIDYVLAKEISSNELGTAWYIYLAPGARWNIRQTPVTLEQVAANLRHWMEDPESALGRDFRDYVERIEVELENYSGQGRIRLDLKQPNFQFFYVFSAYSALIMHPEDGWEFDQSVDGTGAFRIASYHSGREARFVPAANSWKWEERASVPVTFIHLEGQSDVNFDLVPLNGPEQSDLALRRGLSIKHDPLGDTLVIHMDCRSGALKDEKIRKAMRLCCDSVDMLNGISGLGRVSDHTHASNIHQDYPREWEVNSFYDPQKALEIVNGSQISLKLHYMAENIWQKHIAESYVRHAKKVGIKIIPVPVLRKDYDSNWANLPDLTLCKWNHRPLAMQLYRQIYMSSALWNLSGWNDPEFDGLVEKLYATPLGARSLSESMARAMHILQERGPMIQAAWVDCNKAYNQNHLVASTVQVGSGGFIYANRLRII